MNDSLLQIVRALPKIELHRHLEATLRMETMIDIAQEYGIEMPEYDVETLRPFVQMMPYEPRNMQHFIGKFHTLRQFFCSIDVVRRITREAVVDAALDNVKYMELRFTPAALCNLIDATYDDIVSLVCDTVAATAKEWDVQVKLIVSINRHESLEVGEKSLQAALDHRDRGVVALDLAGREPGFPASLFRPVFRRARAEGLHATVHAGEWEGAASVWDAVGNLGAERVGHGIRALEDPGIVEVLAGRGTVLEVCPSSNYDSGVVPSMDEHPLPVLDGHGVLTTINTDDPLISNLTLSLEMARVMEHMGYTLDDVKQAILRAARAAFLPPVERGALVAKFESWLSTNAHGSLQPDYGENAAT